MFINYLLKHIYQSENINALTVKSQMINTLKYWYEHNKMHWEVHYRI